jgi:hypothetical protein
VECRRKERGRNEEKEEEERKRERERKREKERESKTNSISPHTINRFVNPSNQNNSLRKVWRSGSRRISAPSASASRR